MKRVDLWIRWAGWGTYRRDGYGEGDGAHLSRRIAIQGPRPMG